LPLFGWTLGTPAKILLMEWMIPSQEYRVGFLGW